MKFDESVMKKLKVVLNDDEYEALVILRETLPELSDHRLLLGAIRFGLSELKRNPAKVRAFVESRSGTWLRK